MTGGAALLGVRKDCRMNEVIDKAALLDRIDHDLEFLGATLEVYDRDRSELMSQVRAAVSRQDSVALADAAHTLIGLARNFSAKPVLDTALTLERIAESGEFAGAEEALALLEDETSRLRSVLQGIVHARRNSSARDRRRRVHPLMVEHPIRVMTIDDQEIARSGIRFMLGALDDIEVVGEAADGTQGLRLCGELGPDVVLMDMKLPDTDGVAVTRAIRQGHPDTRVLVVTAYHSNSFVKDAMQAGAMGYVMKDASADELAQAIRATRAGQTTLSPEAARALVAQSVSPAPHSGLGNDLTAREREILTLLAKGLRNNQIAKQLDRSPYTVRHHVSELIAKLGASNRAEAAAIAVKHRLVTSETSD
jgi:NarL family two-component system response regulator LiaR